MKERIVDEKLGVIFLNRRANSRGFTFRSMSDGIYVTMPARASRSEFDAALANVRDRLENKRTETGMRQIDFDYTILAPFFKFSLHPCSGSRITARSADGSLEVHCPESTDFTDDTLQQWLRKVIVEAVRRNAQRVLPPRLEALAQKHGFRYQSVKVNSTLSSWGCCTGTNHIRLSWRLMLLPVHLMDYVLLHELCHTVHKSHDAVFWGALDVLVGTHARTLQSELSRSQILI